MAVKAIVKFTVQPGRRDEFVSLYESLLSQHMSTMRAAGCVDSTLYTVVDEPDVAGSSDRQHSRGPLGGRDRLRF